MTSILYLFVFVTVFIGILDAQRFRCDYKYFKEAGGYLKLIEEPTTWDEARLRCDFEGTVLATPLNTNLRKAMLSMLNGTCNRSVWTGLHSSFSQGYFVSVEGVPLGDIQHQWMKCEPDNDMNKEGCVVMEPNGNIADASCNETLSYFCFKKLDPGMAMNECGSPDKEYKLDKRTGKCYKYHRYPRTWSRAYLTCQAEGGHLAISNSDVEGQLIKELANKYPASKNVGSHVDTRVYLGYTNWYEPGEWRTIHGQRLEDAGFAKWSPGEPNNIDKQNCGVMVKSSGMLDDIECSYRAYFICEKDPESLMCDHRKK